MFQSYEVICNLWICTCHFSHTTNVGCEAWVTCVKDITHSRYLHIQAVDDI